MATGEHPAEEEGVEKDAAASLHEEEKDEPEEEEDEDDQQEYTGGAGFPSRSNEETPDERKQDEGLSKKTEANEQHPETGAVVLQRELGEGEAD